MNIFKTIFRAGSKVVSCFIGGVFLFSSLQTQAASLDLPIPLFSPNLLSEYISTSYVAGPDSETPGVLTATGYASMIDGVNLDALLPSTWLLEANILAGGILVGGTIEILGTLTSAGYASGTLLTGNLVEFGFDENGSAGMQFIFEPTGGDLASLYTVGIGEPGINGQGGIKLSVTGYDSDSFNSGFSGTAFGGSADTAPIPVPAAVWLMGSGLVGLASIARRRLDK